GGLFAGVRGLALWASGSLPGFLPKEGQAGGPHPVRIASRWEMQSAQAAIPPAAFMRMPGGLAGGEPPNYGFGLFIEEHPVHGVVVQHSGGYPGFGSNMRWHRASGLGVIALANRTYAGPWVLAERILNALLMDPRRYVRQTPVPGPEMIRGEAGPETRAARDEFMSLFANWDDTAAERLFAKNVALDEPFSERRAAVDT